MRPVPAGCRSLAFSAWPPCPSPSSRQMPVVGGNFEALPVVVPLSCEMQGRTLPRDLRRSFEDVDLGGRPRRAEVCGSQQVGVGAHPVRRRVEVRAAGFADAPTRPGLRSRSVQCAASARLGRSWEVSSSHHRSPHCDLPLLGFPKFVTARRILPDGRVHVVPLIDKDSPRFAPPPCQP